MQAENKENIAQLTKPSQMMLIVGDDGADKVSSNKTSLQENF